MFKLYLFTSHQTKQRLSTYEVGAWILWQCPLWPMLANEELETEVRAAVPSHEYIGCWSVGERGRAIVVGYPGQSSWTGCRYGWRLGRALHLVKENPYGIVKVLGRSGHWLWSLVHSVPGWDGQGIRWSPALRLSSLKPGVPGW